MSDRYLLGGVECDLSHLVMIDYETTHKYSLESNGFVFNHDARTHLVRAARIRRTAPCHDVGAMHAATSRPGMKLRARARCAVPHAAAAEAEF